MFSLRNFIINYAPWIGVVKRFLSALNSTFFIKESYSQFGEDKYLLDLVNRYNLSDYKYVDVGANHPTSISNTYLLYKAGMSGVVIEPNKELVDLFKIFRKRDISLQIGCSDNSSVELFYISKTPVISTFTRDHQFFSESSTRSVKYVPVMKLDDCLKSFQLNKISLLSIDVEGWNRNVLKGALLTCNKAGVVCIEFDNISELDYYKDVLSNNFILDKTFGCNAIFLNRSLL